MLFCTANSNCNCDLPKLQHLPKDHPCYEYVSSEEKLYKHFKWYAKFNKEVEEHKAIYDAGVNKRRQEFDAEEKQQHAQYLREVREHIAAVPEYDSGEELDYEPEH